MDTGNHTDRHLHAGDRLLLAADPDKGELRLYPPPSSTT
jgi:hypothetical protein